jgi:hypothetical protein
LDNSRLTATYAVAYRNTCAQNSPINVEHSSMHLSVNIKAANVFKLSWTPYEGFAFSKYYIYRFASVSGLQLIDSVSSATLVYLDLNAPNETKNLFYFVSAKRDVNCGAADDYVLSNYSVNLAGDEVVGTDENFLSSIEVAPNPSNGQFWIHLDRWNAGKFEIKMINLRGKEVMRQRFLSWESESMMVDVSGLAVGVYHLLFETENGTAVRKLVIR